MATTPGMRVLYISLIFLWQSTTPTLAASLGLDNYGSEGVDNDIAPLINEVKEDSDYVSNSDSNSSKRKIRDVVDDSDYYDYLDAPEPCCGSVINTQNMAGESTGNFSIIESIGSIKITNVADPDHVADPDPAPSKVNDLQNGTIQRDNGHIPRIVYHTTFTWTAPGEDLDTGIVSSYSLRYSQNQTYLGAKHFNLAPEYKISDEQYANILKDAGTEVSLNISLESSTFVVGVPYFFALKAKDMQGNTSPISNLVHVILQPSSTPNPNAESWTSLWWIWLLICIGVLVVIGVLGVLCTCKTKPKQTYAVPREQ